MMNGFSLIFFNNGLVLFNLINEDIKCKIPDQRLHVMSLLFFIFFIKKTKTPQTSFLILEAEKPNLITTMDSFPIKLSKETEIIYI